MALTLDDEQENVLIDWYILPVTGNGLTTYRVEIQGKNGEWHQNLEECNGTDEYIAATTSCIVSVQTLLDAPFSLLYNDSVYARVFSIDAEGWESMTAIQVQQTETVEIPMPSYRQLGTKKLNGSKILGNGRKEMPSPGNSTRKSFPSLENKGRTRNATIDWGPAEL